MNWFVYILECQDGSLYTGITNDLPRRIGEHQQGVGCKYTRGRRPVKLAASRRVGSRGEALSLEMQTKKLNRREKIKQIQSWKEQD